LGDDWDVEYCRFGTVPDGNGAAARFQLALCVGCHPGNRIWPSHGVGGDDFFVRRVHRRTIDGRSHGLWDGQPARSADWDGSADDGPISFYVGHVTFFDD